MNRIVPAAVAVFLSFSVFAQPACPHISELRTAMTQTRQQLGMTTPAFTGAGAGTQIRASHVQELRELAR